MSFLAKLLIEITLLRDIFVLLNAFGTFQLGMKKQDVILKKDEKFWILMKE